jgi:hypothetical protein
MTLPIPLRDALPAQLFRSDVRPRNSLGGRLDLCHQWDADVPLERADRSMDGGKVLIGSMAEFQSERVNAGEE